MADALLVNVYEFALSLILLVYGMFIANAFKSFGEKHHLSDMTLTIAGSLGSIMNGGSRIYFPILQDKHSFALVSNYMSVKLISY